MKKLTYIGNDMGITDTTLYTKDNIAVLLNTYLPIDRYSIIAQTQIEHNELLIENINIAIETVLNGQTAIMPIHVGAIIG